MPWNDRSRAGNDRSRSHGACNKHLGAGHSVLCSLNGHIVRVQATTASGLVVDDPFGASKLTASSYKFSTKNRGRGTGKEWDPTNDTNEGRPRLVLAGSGVPHVRMDLRLLTIGPGAALLAPTGWH